MCHLLLWFPSSILCPCGTYWGYVWILLLFSSSWFQLLHETQDSRPFSDNVSFWLFSILCLIFLSYSYSWRWSKLVTCSLIDKLNMICRLYLLSFLCVEGGVWFQTVTSCWFIASPVSKLIFLVLRHSRNSISWNNFIWTFSDTTRPWITSGCMSRLRINCSRLPSIYIPCYIN